MSSSITPEEGENRRNLLALSQILLFPRKKTSGIRKKTLVSLVQPPFFPILFSPGVPSFEDTENLHKCPAGSDADDDAFFVIKHNKEQSNDDSWPNREHGD